MAHAPSFWLQHGADVNKVNAQGHSAMHTAARLGAKELLETMMDKFGGDLVLRSPATGAAPVHLLVEHGHEDVFCEFVSRRRVLGDDWERTIERSGIRLLGLASFYGQQRAVELLLRSASPSPIELNHVDALGISAVGYAALGGRATVVDVLLDAGADASIAAADGRTPLFLAAQHGFHDVVSLLLTKGHRGEDVHKTMCSIGHTALHAAMQHGDLATVKALLQHAEPPVDVNVQALDGSTPLFLAATHGHVDVLRLLVETHGAAVDVRGPSGVTAFYVAAQNGHRDAVELLLTHGAAIDVTQRDGSTALHIAAYVGQQEMISLLVDHGADVNAVTSHGFTALELASSRGHQDIVGQLLALGADPLAVSTEDNTA
ncbi:hypothetical protein PINS_up009641 [Pythium insidiosum]|nr:hypothetical protein PINS_up009641 [Pythium insidiosum]